MKESSGRSEKTTFRQWLLFGPLVAVLLLAIAAFIYISFFNPDMARGLHPVTTQVLDRVENKLPDGKVDARRSHLAVRIEGVEMHLRPIPSNWDSIAKGDTIEIEVGRSGADGSPVAYNYKKVSSAQPASAPSLP